MKNKTPVEEYFLGKNRVYVKRDDLMGNNVSLPPWGKLHAIKTLLSKVDTSKPLIHLNVFGSWSGWALAELSKKHDMEVHVVYPKTKKIKDSYLEVVESAGGILMPIRHNMMRVLYAQTRNIATENDYNMLPYAFNHDIYVKAMVDRFKKTIQQFEHLDNLVVSSGSGVTITGLAQAFLEFNPKGKVYTVCVSSEDTVLRTMKDRLSMDRVHVVKSDYEFGDVMSDYETPFPCNQNWDKKAWHWIDTNKKVLRGKETLFWNLGGINTFL